MAVRTLQEIVEEFIGTLIRDNNVLKNEVKDIASNTLSELKTMNINTARMNVTEREMIISTIKNEIGKRLADMYKGNKSVVAAIKNINKSLKIKQTPTVVVRDDAGKFVSPNNPTAQKIIVKDEAGNTNITDKSEGEVFKELLASIINKDFQKNNIVENKKVENFVENKTTENNSVENVTENKNTENVENFVENKNIENNTENVKNVENFIDNKNIENITKNENVEHVKNVENIADNKNIEYITKNEKTDNFVDNKNIENVENIVENNNVEKVINNESIENVVNNNMIETNVIEKITEYKQPKLNEIVLLCDTLSITNEKIGSVAESMHNMTEFFTGEKKTDGYLEDLTKVPEKKDEKKDGFFKSLLGMMKRQGN